MIFTHFVQYLVFIFNTYTLMLTFYPHNPKYVTNACMLNLVHWNLHLFVSHFLIKFSYSHNILVFEVWNLFSDIYTHFHSSIVQKIFFLILFSWILCIIFHFLLLVCFLVKCKLVLSSITGSFACTIYFNNRVNAIFIRLKFY